MNKPNKPRYRLVYINVPKGARWTGLKEAVYLSLSVLVSAQGHWFLPKGLKLALRICGIWQTLWGLDIWMGKFPILKTILVLAGMGALLFHILF